MTQEYATGVSLYMQNGVVTFAGLKINKPNTGYRLAAFPMYTSVWPTNSNSFDVTSTGVATQLAFTKQPPSSVSAGAPFGLAVSAVDDFGKLDKSFTGNVTLSLQNLVSGFPGPWGARSRRKPSRERPRSPASR